jgi:hypothetical protein
MGPYPRKGVEALLELALACVATDQENRPQMIDATRDLEVIMRDTVAPPESHRTPSPWGKAESSLNDGGGSWDPRKTILLDSLHTNDTSWTSTDELMASRTKGAVEMEPR